MYFPQTRVIVLSAFYRENELCRFYANLKFENINKMIIRICGSFANGKIARFFRLSGQVKILIYWKFSINFLIIPNYIGRYQDINSILKYSFVFNNNLIDR